MGAFVQGDDGGVFRDHEPGDGERGDGDHGRGRGGSGSEGQVRHLDKVGGETAEPGGKPSSNRAAPAQADRDTSSEEQRRQQRALPDRGASERVQGAEGEADGEQGEDADGHDRADDRMRCLTDPVPGANPEQHGQQREAERRETEQERCGRAGEPHARGGDGVERDVEVAAVAEQPDVDGCPPEHHPVDLQPILHRPQYGERHERNAHADAHDEQRLERGEEGGERTIHTPRSLPAERGIPRSPFRHPPNPQPRLRPFAASLRKLRTLARKSTLWAAKPVVRSALS